MFSKEDFKDFKKTVTAVLENCNFHCSVRIHNIDSVVSAFAVLHGAKVSWGRTYMAVFTPAEATFHIPFVEIREFHRCGDNQIEIVLEGRNLVSIRKADERRRPT
jgi:hypothetical protein